MSTVLVVRDFFCLSSSHVHCVFITNLYLRAVCESIWFQNLLSPHSSAIRLSDQHVYFFLVVCVISDRELAEYTYVAKQNT